MRLLSIIGVLLNHWTYAQYSQNEGSTWKLDFSQIDLFSPLGIDTIDNCIYRVAGDTLMPLENEHYFKSSDTILPKGVANELYRLALYYPLFNVRKQGYDKLTLKFVIDWNGHILHLAIDGQFEEICDTIPLSKPLQDSIQPLSFIPKHHFAIVELSYGVECFCICGMVEKQHSSETIFKRRKRTKSNR